MGDNVACDQCDGTGIVTIGNQQTIDTACPASHVVLEIPPEARYVNDGPRTVFADPDKIMWWCEADKESETSAVFADHNRAYWCNRDHPESGCGWVRRPTETWRETR